MDGKSNFASNRTRNTTKFLTMRLASHSLPKPVHKKTRSVKHKDSAAKRARKEQKKAKAEAMDIDEPVAAAARASQSEVDREEARLQRKKANAHRIAYKQVKKIR